MKIEKMKSVFIDSSNDTLIWNSTDMKSNSNAFQLSNDQSAGSARDVLMYNLQQASCVSCHEDPPLGGCSDYKYDFGLYTAVRLLFSPSIF